MGFFVSNPVKRGETITTDEVDQHIFGFAVLNTWSSRDFQTFEMKPLGPFDGKSMCALYIHSTSAGAAPLNQAHRFREFNISVDHHPKCAQGLRVPSQDCP